jgi:hypothetical protein
MASVLSGGPLESGCLPIAERPRPGMVCLWQCGGQAIPVSQGAGHDRILAVAAQSPHCQPWRTDVAAHGLPQATAARHGCFERPSKRIPHQRRRCWSGPLKMDVACRPRRSRARRTLRNATSADGARRPSYGRNLAYCSILDHAGYSVRHTSPS